MTGLILAGIVVCGAFAAGAVAAWPGISLEIAEYRFQKGLRHDDPAEVARALYGIDRRLLAGQRRQRVIGMVCALLGSENVAVLRAAILAGAYRLDGLDDSLMRDELLRAIDRYNRAQRPNGGCEEKMILEQDGDKLQLFLQQGKA